MNFLFKKTDYKKQSFSTFFDRKKAITKPVR